MTAHGQRHVRMFRNGVPYRAWSKTALRRDRHGASYVYHAAECRAYVKQAPFREGDVVRAAAVILGPFDRLDFNTQSGILHSRCACAVILR